MKKQKKARIQRVQNESCVSPSYCMHHDDDGPETAFPPKSSRNTKQEEYVQLRTALSVP